MPEPFKNNTVTGQDKQKSQSISDVERAKGLAGLQRFDAYVQSCLSGMLANPAWNSESAQRYMTAKGLTLEQLAVASAMEVIIQVDKFFKGEVGGEKPQFENQRAKLIVE